MVKISILDGYIDEPTCLGVPPYISPYPRYLAGAIWSFDKKAIINYVTIDQLRTNNDLMVNLSKSNIVITIAGMTVPGRYLSGFPISPNEIKNIMNLLSQPIKILSGPAARYGFGISGGKKTRETDFVKTNFDLIIEGDLEIVVYNLLKNKLKLSNIDTKECRENAHFLKDFAVSGARVVKQHPYYPNLITEIETYRGCPRSITGGCSFCSEPSKGLPDFRPISDVLDEIKALYDNGVRHFRIGNQPCIFSYMAKDAGKVEFPRPNPEALEQLFKGIRSLAPNLQTLHIDNANPGVIARYPKECKKIAKTIVKYHTSGDVAAFGIESVDPVVIKKNNLKALEDEVLSAIKLLNEIGSKRGRNGMPELLPGLNFVFGLEGESKNTFELNYEFLKNILDENLLLRRINLRQIIPIPGTKMYEIGSKNVIKNKNIFQRFKRKVKENIEQPMLKRLLPTGTILKAVYSEKYDGKLTFGRQFGSYPLLIGIPGIHDLKTFFDVKVVEYGYRSITAVPYPIDINNAPKETIQAIPGIGKKRTIRILANRPFKDKKQLLDILDDPDVANKLMEYVSF
ncbi:radical SAM protein [Thermoplasmatales archaeon SG8-52-4]|nr:MAG: radical SAM protein [Thermoplasmatales archaeon SG8-52-4]